MKLEKEVMGPALFALMESRGMSQSDLARSSGLARSKVNQYVRGKVAPRLASLQKMLDAMDASLVDLIERSVLTEESEGVDDLLGGDMAIKFYDLLVSLRTRVELLEAAVRGLTSDQEREVNQQAETVEKEIRDRLKLIKPKRENGGNGK